MPNFQGLNTMCYIYLMSCHGSTIINSLNKFYILQQAKQFRLKKVNTLQFYKPFEKPIAFPSNKVKYMKILISSHW